jgi:hypothetical protein
VRNVPTEKIPLLNNVCFEGATGCNLSGLTEGRGFVPGLQEDISDLSPLSLIEAVRGGGNVGSLVSRTVSLPIRAHIYDPRMECYSGAADCKGKSWQMMKKCSPSYLLKIKTTSPLATFTIPTSPSPLDICANDRRLRVAATVAAAAPVASSITGSAAAACGDAAAASPVT